MENDSSAIKYTIYSTLQPHTDVLFSLINLNDGNFASCSRDSSINIYNGDFSIKHSFNPGHSNGIRAIAQLSMSNGMIASTGNAIKDKSITITDPNQNYSVVSTMQMGTGFGTSLFTLQNGTLVSGSSFPDSKIYLWDSSFNLIKTLRLNIQEAIFVCELKDGLVATGFNSNSVTICDIETNAMNYLEGFTGSATALIRLEDGTIVLSTDKGGIYTYDSAYTQISKIETSEKITCLVKVDKDTFATGDVFGNIKIYRRESNSQKSISLIQSLVGGNDRVRCLLVRDSFIIAGLNEGSMVILKKE